MKKLILLTTVLAVLASCGSGDRGELVGVKGKNWHPEKPYGMELIPGGSFIMGKADDDLAGVNDVPSKTVTVTSNTESGKETVKIKAFVKNGANGTPAATPAAISTNKTSTQPGHEGHNHN